MSSSENARDPSALLCAAFDVGPDAVLVFDRQRNVVHANAPARRLFAEDIVGLSPSERAARWTFRDEAGRLMSADAAPSARGLRGETVRDAKCELVSPGRHRHVTVDAFPLRDGSGAIDGVMCVLRESGVAVKRPRLRLFEGQPLWIGPGPRPDRADARTRVLAEAGRALGTSLQYTEPLEMIA